MLFVPSATGVKHHHHRLPEQMNTTLQAATKDDKTMPLKFNVSTTTTTTAAAQAQPQHAALAKETNNNSVTRKAAKSAEIVEAMRKLDAKLVAYLVAADAVEDSNNNGNASVAEMPSRRSSDKGTAGGTKAISHLIEEFAVAANSQLNIFRRVAAIKLHMEALTLQPEGMKYMDLLQNEMRPIFTVECQLSHELIARVPRHNLFHVLQFESEKFHSVTLCARFGQEAQRAVRFQLDEGDDAAAMQQAGKSNFGRIRFAVWWREPGTCLNEMLGLGVLDLAEMYDAGLLEKCNSVQVYKRGVHLASIYFKVSLLLDLLASSRPAVETKASPQQQQCTGSDCEHSNDDNGKKAANDAANGNKLNAQTAASAARGATIAAPLANSGASGNNVGPLLEASQFASETSKLRMLKGFLYVNATRNLAQPPQGSFNEFFLVCRRFWQDEPAVIAAAENSTFNYQEQFSIINDASFLQSVNKRHLQLELWRRVAAGAAHDDNGNNNVAAATRAVQPFGIVRLPLHHFYIAYRDTAIANHICKGKLPVISIDAWVPIEDACQVPDSGRGAARGELECLLAIGSEEQISHLRATRGFSNAPAPPLSLANNFPISQIALDDAPGVAAQPPAAASPSQSDSNGGALLDILQGVLQQRVPVAAVTSTPQPLPGGAVALLLHVRAARNLPHNPSKRKKGAKRRTAKPGGDAPTCYVTFQAQAATGGKSYKSHEGEVYATDVAPSAQPKWEAQFRLHLNNAEKCLVLKVWRKTGQGPAAQSPQPTPLEDAIIGFVALDLTAFQRDSAQLDGWFNIVDFNGRVNGQLYVGCGPLSALDAAALAPSAESSAAQSPASNVDAVIDHFESTLELAHLNLGQAINRKYTELAGISQRLRTRLAEVTGAQLSSTDCAMDCLQNWQPPDVGNEADLADDDDVDWFEFERDISMPPALVDAADSRLSSSGQLNCSESSAPAQPTNMPATPECHDE